MAQPKNMDCNAEAWNWIEELERRIEVARTALRDSSNLEGHECGVGNNLCRCRACTADRSLRGEGA